MRWVMQEGVRETAASMRAEMDTALGRVAISLRQARMIGILNALASCLTFLAVATAVWAVIH